ncbi:MAG: outer membrane lipoprotein carrier protein LolA, partial [Rickettsiales bacterium]|nr:outer membrane lipoprotein carrier protein LolA [Rickettsiales bacterium]
MHLKSFIAIAAIALIALLPLSSKTEEASPTASKDDQVILSEIQGYLNTITTLVADFSQAAPDQEISEGVFYLKRPGNFRWEYTEPTPIIIVGRDDLVTYYDVELEEISYVTLENALAHFLGRRNISIPSEDISLLNLSHFEGEALVSLYQTDKPDEGVLTLHFTLEPKVE